MSDDLGTTGGAGATARTDREPIGVPAPRSRGRRRRTPLRVIMLWLDAAARRDRLLVALMVVAMTLSAFSVYQATQAGDAADERLGELRLAEGDAARQSGYLQTIVAHDLDVMTRFCEAEIARRAALSGVVNGTVDAAAISSHTIMTRSLRPLVLGDRLAQCQLSGEGPGLAAHYDIERARQSLESSQDLRRNPVASPGREDAVLAERSAAESALMIAGLLFAVVLALLITVDLLGRRGDRPAAWGSRAVTRWRRALLALGAPAAIAGIVLLVVFSIRLPSDATARLVALGFAGFVAVTTVLVFRTASAGALGREQRRRPHWWSEIIGAGTLVAFSLAAVGLAAVSAAEREASMRADALQGSAQQLQQLGEQSAVRDLDAVATSAGFAAETAAAATLRLTDPARSSAQIDELSALYDRFGDQVAGFDEAIRRQGRAGLAAACPTEHPPSSRHALRPTADPFALYTSLADEEDNVLWHVRQLQEPALACDTASAIAREEARIWARHGSLLTVALVILGLAGFMLSLASGSDRDPRLSRILRGVGATGLGVGLIVGALSLPDLVLRASLPEPDDANDLAKAVAAARIDPCGHGALRDLDRAIARFDGYGPAFEARGRAHLCLGAANDWWRWTSDASPDAVAAAIGDFEEARRHGVSGPTIDQDEGWLRLLDGIQRDDADAVMAGLVLTNDALSTIEDASAASGSRAPGTSLHVARFNRALAHAALGEEATAREAYEQARRCLDPASGCPGGGLLDPSLSDDVTLWALADMELLGERLAQGDQTWDAYRLMLVDAPTSFEAREEPIGSRTLSVYPQDAYVRADSAPAQAALVWYWRADTSDTWSLLQVPSGRTLHPGGYLHGRAIALGERAVPGFYRADVYSDGGRHPAMYGARYAPPADGVRVVSTRLMLSAFVPAWWASGQGTAEEAGRDDGLDWHVGPTPDSGLTIRRIEGVILGDDPSSELREALRGWAAESRQVDSETLVFQEDGYFLGSSSAESAETPDRGARFAVAYEPYAWEAPTLGGTLFLLSFDGAMGAAPDAARVDPAWIEEIVMETPQQSFPTQRVTDDGVSLEISEAWSFDVDPDAEEGSGWHMALTAGAPDGSPVLEVRQETEEDVDVTTAIDEWERELRDGASPWQDVVIGARSPVAVPGAIVAERFDFTAKWQGQRYTVAEVWASDGTTRTYLRVYDLEADLWNMRATIDAALSSLRLEG